MNNIPAIDEPVSVLRKFQEERELRFELLEACKAQHNAIDILLAMLVERDSSFFPSKSKAWSAVLQGNAAIKKAEGGASC